MDSYQEKVRWSVVSVDLQQVDADPALRRDALLVVAIAPWMTQVCIAKVTLRPTQGHGGVTRVQEVAGARGGRG